jgi:hypothetical protein
MLKIAEKVQQAIYIPYGVFLKKNQGPLLFVRRTWGLACLTYMFRPMIGVNDTRNADT